MLTKSPGTAVVLLAIVVASCGSTTSESVATPPQQPAQATTAGAGAGAACSCGAAGDERHCAAELRCCCGPTSPNIASGGAGWCAESCPEPNPAAGGGGVAGSTSEHETEHGAASSGASGGGGGAAAGPCRADAAHCCLDDGSLVRPGGCQPSYPNDVQPATVRGADGRCEPVPCYLRCLPATARIATPSGDVAVSSLRAGDRVLTLDRAGGRIAVPVRLVRSVPVVGSHTVVELTLADGRVLRASPGHPTADGALVGSLAPSAALDGSTVVSARHVPYDGSATWDLLPAGPTGAYWADGVLLGSTLAEP